MVKIRKNNQILTVPQSAYQEIYKSLGWVAVAKKSEKVAEQKPKAVTETKPITDKAESLRSLSQEELEQYAIEKGIDPLGMSKKSLINALLKKEG